MYKKILITTDGSERSERAIAQGLALARALGAEVLAFNAGLNYRVYAGGMADFTFAVEAQYRESCEEQAKALLGAVETAAAKAGVACQTRYCYGEPVHQAILDAAEEGECDLIVMGSHGRGSIGTLLLGSTTQKVLVHGSLPVLVVR